MTDLFVVVETDNYDSDYPDEKVLSIPPLPEKFAERIADAINAAFPSGYERYWTVKPKGYVPQPGFEP